jgi:uncharacterized protein YqhQ
MDEVNRQQIEKTRKPMIAGILSIVAGSTTLLLAAYIYVVLPLILGISWGPTSELVPYIVFVFAFLVLGVLAIIGGIYAIQKRNWGQAYAGTIAALLLSLPLGTAAIILLRQSKTEFR